MIDSAFVGIRFAYMMLYPNYSLGMINRHTSERVDLGEGEWKRTDMVDTGICFGVAMVVQDYLRLRFQQESEIVYIYRRYDAEEGDGFEDVLVHAVLFAGGRFYDTDDFNGVEKFEDLTYIKSFDGLGVRDHYPVYAERGDTGSRDEIRNKISDKLHAAIENIFTISIPRRSIF